MRRTSVRALVAAASVAAVMPAMLAAQLPILPQQGPPPDPNLRFEVASVKAADASDGATTMRLMPGSFEASRAPLRSLLRQALQKPEYQIVGAPSWVDTERYTVAAKAGSGAPPNAIAVMLVNLLKDRFQMTTHAETRELPIFHLVVARADKRLGPNLKESSAECQAARAGGAGPGGGPGGPPRFDPNAPIPCGSMRTGPGMLGAGGRSIAQLVQMLSDSTGRPVVDKTGLTSLYDFSLRFAPEPSSFALKLPPGVLPPPDPDAPNLYTAVQEQLGLKLDNARGPVEVVVIDRIEKPTLD